MSSLKNLELEDGRLSPASIALLKQYSDMLECQCPGKLLGILDSIREFTTYTAACIDQYPDDARTHQWLQTASLNLDKLLCGTIIQLARMEGFVNEANELSPRHK